GGGGGGWGGVGGGGGGGVGAGGGRGGRLVPRAGGHALRVTALAARAGQRHRSSRLRRGASRVLARVTGTLAPRVQAGTTGTTRPAPAADGGTASDGKDAGHLPVVTTGCPPAGCRGTPSV